MRVFLILIEQMWAHQVLFAFPFSNCFAKSAVQMLLKCQPCPQSAEKYIFVSDFTNFFITIFGLLADLDLQYFGALVTYPTPALKSLACLQTVENGIKLLTLTVHMLA